EPGDQEAAHPHQAPDEAARHAPPPLAAPAHAGSLSDRNIHCAGLLSRLGTASRLKRESTKHATRKRAMRGRRRWATSKHALTAARTPPPPRPPSPGQRVAPHSKASTCAASRAPLRSVCAWTLAAVFGLDTKR